MTKNNGDEIMNADFEAWWHNWGSGITKKDCYDWEEHLKKVSFSAWNVAINDAAVNAYKSALQETGDPIVSEHIADHVRYAYKNNAHLPVKED
jgi:hypothetical protein